MPQDAILSCDAAIKIDHPCAHKDLRSPRKSVKDRANGSRGGRIQDAIGSPEVRV